MRRRAFLAATGHAVIGTLASMGAGLRAQASNARPRVTVGTEVVRQLEKRLPELMREANVPGLAIVLVRDGRIAWRREFGVADASTGKPVDQFTIFEAQSMSKPVFAYAVMKLKERGIIDLDKPLTSYTPERVLENDPRLDLITARHVLSHASGFQNWRTTEEPLSIHFTPGEKWMYSGEGYSYLQSVVTRLTGHVDTSRCEKLEGDVRVCASDIDAYLKANLLKPFGMTSSTYTWNARLAGHAARPHDENGKPFDKPRPTDIRAARYACAGALMSTPSDYARFLIEVIGRKPASAFRLAPATVTEMTTPIVQVLEDPRHSSWALGWQIFGASNGNIIAHGGDDTGTHCYCGASLDQRSAFVIMTNGEGGLKLLLNYMFAEAMEPLLTG